MRLLDVIKIVSKIWLNWHGSVGQGFVDYVVKFALILRLERCEIQVDSLAIEFHQGILQINLL